MTTCSPRLAVDVVADTRIRMVAASSAPSLGSLPSAWTDLLTTDDEVVLTDIEWNYDDPETWPSGWQVEWEDAGAVAACCVGYWWLWT